MMSTGHTSLIECMTAASIPSTLVKCLYIFLDLPSKYSTGCTFHAKFRELLQRLCLYPIVAEELARKDALCHLFNALTDWCAPHNTAWRMTTTVILSTIAQNSLSPVVIKRIHDSECVRYCLKKISESKSGCKDFVNSFISLLHVVRESSVDEQVLLDDFRNNNGYFVLSEFCLKLEESGNPDSEDSLQTLVALVSHLATCGSVELRPKAGAGEQVHKIPGFRIHMPKTQARKSVRNMYAFDVLQSLFNSSSTINLGLLVLKTVQSLLLQDLSNYFILEQQNILVAFAKKIFEKSYEIQEAYFDLLEVLVDKLHYVFMKEINSIVVQMKLFNLSPSLVIAYRHFIQLLRISPVFKDVFHDVGLLELSVDILNYFVDTMETFNDPSTTPSTSCPFESLKEIGNYLLEFLQCTVTSHTQNGDVLIRLGATNCLLNRILNANAKKYIISLRLPALTIYEELMLSNGGEELMPNLLENMHHAHADLKISILCSFCRVLRESHRCRAVFRKLSGFVYVMQELIYLEGCLNLFTFTNNLSNSITNSSVNRCSISTADSSHLFMEESSLSEHMITSSKSDHDGIQQQQQHLHLSRKAFLSSLTYPQLFLLIKSIFSSLGIAMKFEPANAHYFVTEIQYTTLTDAVLSLGSNKQTYTLNDNNNNPHNQFISVNLNELMNGFNDTAYHQLRSIQSKYLYALFMNLKLMESLLLFPLSHSPSSCSNSILTSPNLSKVKTVCETTIDGYHPEVNKSSGADTAINLPRRIVEWCVICRYFYDLAIDAYDRDSIRSILLDKDADSLIHQPNHTDETLSTTSVVANNDNTIGNTGLPFNNNYNNTTSDVTDILIIHPDAVIGLLKLIANLNEFLSCQFDCRLSDDLLIDFQSCLLTVIADLLHNERNQQIMCNAYMPRKLLDLFHKPLADDNHPLHDQIRGLFECLAIQALTPNDLREFLRLSDTLSTLDASLVYPTKNDLSNSSFSLSDEAKVLLSKSLSFRLNPLTLCQIKCLIAMSTPLHVEFNKQIIRRDSRINYSSVRSNSTMNSEIGLSISPSFVEFNMSTEGFGCLFLPSIAPQGSSSISRLCGAVNSSSNSAANSSMNEMNAGGGVGAGERSFPPSGGFTYSAWVSVSQFDSVTNNSYDIGSMKQSFQQQPQAVHLLTLVRGVQSVNDQLVFLRIYIHPLNHYLVVSTQERLLQPGQSCDLDVDCSTLLNNHNSSTDQPTAVELDSNMKSAIGTGTCAVFPCGFLQNSSNEWPLDVWRHVVVVFNRAGMIKTSSCSLYLDGHFIGSRRVTYIGASSASSALGRNIMPSSLCGFVGTPASMRRSSKLLWKIGPFHFIEEPLTANRIAIMAKLGPNYMGSFQATPSMPSFMRPDVDESNFPLFSEDKLVFGIYACNLSTLTLSRIRKVYNQCDAKAIARQFYLSPKENATPIRILRNSALHLHGPARPLGAVLVGYQGVRTFTPNPICRLIHCVTGGEGMAIGLALIAIAQDVETLYASNKAACALIKSNSAASSEMLRTSGYQIYAVLLRRKRHLLTTRILDSILSLALNMNSWTDKSSTSQTFSSMDHPAFENLVCDLDLWRIERELTKDTEICVRRNALATGFIVGDDEILIQKHSNSDKIKFIEDDYQLVANLISHLMEFLPNPLPKSNFSCNKSHNDLINSSTNSSDNFELIIHPIWNVIFDHVIYLLMNAYSNWTQGNYRHHLVIDVIGRMNFTNSCLSFIQLCLSTYTSSKWFLRFCQLIVWTLPNSSQTNETFISLDQSYVQKSNDGGDMLMLSTELLRYLIILRNRCLESLIQLITETDCINGRFCNELLGAVGFDWFYLLLRPNIHPTSVSHTLHLLLLLILNPDQSFTSNYTVLQQNLSFILTQMETHSDSFNESSLPTNHLQKCLESDSVIAFRLGCPAGRWLRGCEILLKKRHGLLIDNSKSSSKRKPPLRYTAALRDLKLSSCQQPGFTILQMLLPYHLDLVETFLFLFALFLKIPVRRMPRNVKFDFDTFYSFIACENTCTSPLTLMKHEINTSNVANANHSTNSISFTSSPIGPSGYRLINTSATVTNNIKPAFMTVSKSSVVASKHINVNTSVLPHSVVSTIPSTVKCSNLTASTVNQHSNQYVCPEAGTLILQLIRVLIYQPESLQHLKMTEFISLMESKTLNISTNIESSVAMLKFMIYLYQSKPVVQLVFITPGLLINLIGLLIPFTYLENNNPSAYPSPLKRSSSNHKNLIDQLLSCPSSPSAYTKNSIHQITLDFIKLIVSDSFTLHPTFLQPTHIVDILLEAWSNQCSSKQHQNLQTLILYNLMDHFVATDILNDESLRVGPNGNIDYIPANLIYFAARIVDKLWQGCFSKEANRIIDFLIHLITHWPDQSTAVPSTTAGSKLGNSVNNNISYYNILASKFSIHSLYRSLNRTILYQLSRPILTKADQLQIINLLDRLNTTLIHCNNDNNNPTSINSMDAFNAGICRGCIESDQLRDTSPGCNNQIPLIFSSVNEDTEFPACLVHLLIQLIRLNDEHYKSLQIFTNSSSNNTGLMVNNKSSTLSKISSITSGTISSKNEIDNSNDIPIKSSSSVNYYYHTTFEFDELESNLDDTTLSSSTVVENTTLQTSFQPLSTTVTTMTSESSTTTNNQPTKSHLSENELTSNSSTSINSIYSKSTHAHSKIERDTLKNGKNRFDEISDPSSNYANDIVVAALKLWSECYLAKKSILAQLVPEAPLVSGLSVPSLNDWATILEGPCLIAWAQHVDCEASGSGGISTNNLWGRIPGTPLSVLSMFAQENCSPASTTAITTTTSASASLGLQHQITMKLNKVSGNMFKLGSTSNTGTACNSANVNEQTSGSTVGANPSVVNNTNVQINYLSSPNGAGLHIIQENALEAIQLWAPNQMNFIHELLDQQKTQFYQNLSFNQRHLESEWEKIENELTRERGLWGRITPDPLAKWELDPTEGPLRMRKRMILNKSFNSRYPYLPNYLLRLLTHFPSRCDNSYLNTLTLTKSKKPRSRDSKLYFLNYKSKSLLHEDYGPVAPWLQLTKSRELEELTKILEEADNDINSRTTPTDKSYLDGSDLTSIDHVRQQQKDEDDDGTFDCGRSLVPESEFTELSQSLDPESLELSLQKTASLIRSARSSVCADQQKQRRNDDLDELVAISRSVSEEPEEFTTYCDGDDIDSSSSSKQPLDQLDTHSPHVNNRQLQQSYLSKASVINSNQNVSKDFPNPVNNFTGLSEDKLAGHEAILRLLEPGERLHVMYRCARILGLDIFEGLLLFGKAHFYVIDGYTLINTREIVAIDSLPSHIIHEPIVPSSLVGVTNNNNHGNNNTLTRSSIVRVNMSSTDLWSSGAVSQIAGKQYFKFPYENIQEVHKRRYLLHPIALEVFNSDGRNFLLAFSKGLQNKVYECFQNVASANSDFNQQKSSQSFFSSLLGVKSMVQRWEHGELSNFEYLMYLNTQAGRSYNDLIQYPIFPWVLADYESDELDLSRPETFRDLSKPMGAQTPDRLAQFQRRFREWDDPTGETPPYHYGTHYSSAMIVVSYLFRMEPFAQHFLKLQGGHFDLPDRMFHCVRDAWLSASKHNMADVRELVPEFFYLPDFLINSNNFEMGIKQNGVEVNNVVLPPWAKSDPREFIRVHREALESEYVSAHLHEWIDLIFGYKQQGEHAIQASNVFHYLFYEGNVDIYSIDDPLKRSAVIGFINNFGQIPKQLFKKPHPCRRVIIPRPSTRFFSSATGFNSGSQLACELFYRNLDILRPSLQPIKELRHAVGQIVQLDPQFIPSGANINNMNTGATVNRPILSLNINSDSMNCDNINFSENNNLGGSGSSYGYQTSTTTLIGGPIVAVEQNKCLLPPNYTHYLAWGFTDGSLRLGSLFDSNERVRYVFEMVDQNEILCCASPNKYTIITAGLSTVVRVWFLSSNEMSGGSNMTSNTSGVGILSGSGSSSSAYGYQSFGGPRLKLRATLYGHTDAITCLAASDSFNLIVSGSRDRSCILWDLSRLCFLRQLPGHIAPIAAVCINEATGDIASCSGTQLYLWNCNGDAVASVDTPVGRNKQILCVCMSTLYDWDAENVILTGSSDGVVRMWCLKHIYCTNSGTNHNRVDQNTLNINQIGNTGGDSHESSIEECRTIDISVSLTVIQQW
ncbi:WD repeat and FYVE domain-containing protein isoform 3 [Schistosoma japonicum]|uniref:WD repeat and FYVE domain-containing protein isoform 3 n=1 Tax=Schistosoma japonicum TaxID=6182 RepID=A0A4Z2DVB3_SCHJA|nr:WD repeat and FYVE domain-containing protein isoform 3 [Schistosoma japonicum]